MAERKETSVYSIAAHRGFADALVAGLVPRYNEGALGLANLTLLLPSARAGRTVSEAFIRHAGEQGRKGLLMPRMAMVGDLDLEETLGALLDPLGSSDIPPAVEPTRRWLELARILAVELEAEEGETPSRAATLRMARELASTIDRLLVEQIEPQDLLSERVLTLVGDLSEHWKESTRVFARVLVRWRSWLDERGLVDAAERRNRLFERAARQWRTNPPDMPIVAAGVTSAAPALAKLLRVIADLPQGAVILPDLDLAMSDDAWNELGRAGAPAPDDQEVFAKSDAVTHPQYHLKLLLNRMSVNRAEVQPWHRRGLSASAPQRSRAVSALFLPPQASKAWIDMPSEERRFSDLRLLQSATIEEEAQSIALLVREALEEPEKRVAVITPDRGLARRVSQHLQRWNIAADDTAGRPLDLTPAGRLFLLLAEIASEGPLPIPLVAALGHPLVHRGEPRRAWLASLRAFERRLRGPRPSPGLAPLGTLAKQTEEDEWWAEVEPILAPLTAFADREDIALADALSLLAEAAEALAGDAVWSAEDGRALSAFIEDLRNHAGETQTSLAPPDLTAALRDAMAQIAVRPPYGGHPRVAIYGLLESRMTRADLVICGGLNEGTWPGIPGPDPILAPALLRALGVPANDFRIGLAAHDLAGALGAPEVIVSRALRDADGPTIPSRFLSRIEALLGEKSVSEHRELTVPRWVQQLDRDPPRAQTYARPQPDPAPELRKVDIRVTALDRLLGDPYQFYAQSILDLRVLDPLDGDVTQDPAWQGTLAHDMIEEWHRVRQNDPSISIEAVAREVLARKDAHPLLRGLWLPRLLEGLKWVEETVNAQTGREVLGVELKGAMQVDGVKVYGRADRIDSLEDGSLAIIDYKTGKPPSKAEVAAGYRLQLGILGLILANGSFELENGDLLSGKPSSFEFWSLRKANGEFGELFKPYKDGPKQGGLLPEDFIPHHEAKLFEAIRDYIKGRKPFTAKLNPDYPGYADFDQLMRLEEWQIALADEDDAA
ncbi:double-strand break repair protein AddB [Altererythrobacter sp. GH1-8]|uniref:double-strand break repair protein AddB n=1 Tax=Altererythrobacter sp. GH1-8 TaxID=3349333 RepID=UPI00374CFA26